MFTSAFPGRFYPYLKSICFSKLLGKCASEYDACNSFPATCSLKTSESQGFNVFCKKLFLKIHTKTPVRESLFEETVACNFIKKETLAQVFSFCEIFNNNFFIEHLWMLLLYFTKMTDSMAGS